MADLRVETTHGALRGSMRSTGRGSVAIWKGIPYAAPPVGRLRFRPPQPAAPWTGERDATEFGPVATQTRDPRMALLSGVSDKMASGEDCLYLNVYAPAERTGPRPVMVWIHGGAFIMGSGSTPLYDGAPFAERGVVVVTLNYRLGVPGFLYLGDVASGYAEGNCALLDQVAALAWVRDNIAAFGGDPGCVTVMGESAGAISIGVLLAMPAARGLFHRAILQSGAAALELPTRERATATANEVLAALGITGDQIADSLADTLAALPIDPLLAAQEQLSRAHGTAAFAPYIDGTTVPRSPAELIRDGSAAGVPLLLGSNRDEWTLFQVFIGPATVEAFKQPLRKRLGATVDRLVEAYRDAASEPTELRAWTDLIGDLVFRIPALRLAEAQAELGTPVHVYRFDWASPAFGGKLGATHALELPFVWNRLDLPATAVLVGNDLTTAAPLAAAIHQTWVNFIASGDPNGGGLPTWPRYDTVRRPTLVIDRESRVVDDPGGALRALWVGL